MNQKELTKTFMMTLLIEKLFGLHGLYENISVLQGLRKYDGNCEESLSK